MARGKTIRERHRNYVFSIDSIKQLMEKLRAKKEFYVDEEIRKRVFAKWNTISGIMNARFTEVKQDNCTEQKLIDYIRDIDDMENVDLDYHKNIARRKLAIIRVGKKCRDGSLYQDEIFQKSHNVSGLSSTSKRGNFNITNMSQALQD